MFQFICRSIIFYVQVLLANLIGKELIFVFQDIAIDITGRDPTDNPTGIPYRLVAEACVPTINVADIGAIFEEHRIVKNLSVWQHSQQVRSF